MKPFSIAIIFTFQLIALGAGILLPGEAAAAPQETAGAWSVRDFGAIGDGQTKDTVSIQQAIDAAAQAGGGIVRLTPGRYLSGSISLRSGITFRLEKGAMLLGSTDISDYPEHQPPRPSHGLEYGRYALLHAEGLHDVTIEGEGIVDGQGKHESFNIGKRRQNGMSIADAVSTRPFLLAFTRCARVSVRGVTLQNSAYWVQNYLDCDGVSIDSLTVRSRVNGNNDGIDIDGCRNVRVSNCDISTSDDALCLKASYTDCQRVAIENCILSSGCNAFKCGTASIAGFKEITASNCIVYDTNLSGIALEIVDGGVMDGVVVRGFVMRNVGSAILVRLGDRKRAWVDVEAPPPIGEIRNVLIADIVANGCGEPRKKEMGPLPASITGLPGHLLRGIMLCNIQVNHIGGGTSQQAGIKTADIPEAPRGYPEFDIFGDLPCYGLFCRHVEGLTLRGVEFGCETPDARPALITADVPRLHLSGVIDRGESTGESAH